MTRAVEFIPLLNFENQYEILNQFQFTIRKVRDHYEVKESNDNKGYPRVKLDLHDYRKHFLIAQQFIPNDDPEHKNQIDHINRDRTDYHIENLRWITQSENNRNKSSNNGVEYTYVDEISDDAIVVNDYGKHEFENYYYAEATDKFYFYNGNQYRELHINEDKRTQLKFVIMNNKNNQKIRIYYGKFKRLYNLI
ncbi:hypothetical protein M9Y10_017180 [Tritrichomonas musculus]|uniref:HNH nuclease domain-containing protein n=1 Tax=Tritrichomonas musculus TaxID=1915356 RepID=A0ABR2HWH0_9EUKA